MTFFLVPLKPDRVSEFLSDKHQHTDMRELLRAAELLQSCLSETAPHCCRAMHWGFFSHLALKRSLSRTIGPSYNTAKLHFRNDAPQLCMERSDADRAASQDAVSDPPQICSVHTQPLQLAPGSVLIRS